MRDTPNPSPTQLPGIWPGKPSTFVTELGMKLAADDCAGLAAEMTYNWMLSLMPSLIFLFSVFGMFGSQPDVLRRILTLLNRLIPREAFTLVQASLEELTKDSSGGLAIAGLIGSLWAASNGAAALEKALSRAHGVRVPKRSIWKQRLVAVLIVLGLAVIMLICTNLIVFGEVIISMVQHAVYLPEQVLQWFGLVRWVLPIASLILISLFIYNIAPESDESVNTPKTVWPGAITFVVLWIVVSVLFSMYVTNLGNFNHIYGPMGAIIVLMIWLYLSSYALLIGGSINALIARDKPSTK